jgi:ketosteroid isomerase-like protein
MASPGAGSRALSVTSQGPAAYAAGHLVTASELPQCISTYFDALNTGDSGKLASVWAETAELRAVGARPRRGRDEILAFYENLFGSWSTHVDRPTRVVVADGIVVVEVQFTGVTHAGRELSFDAVDVFDLLENLILRLSTWYDLGWVRRQL